MRPRVDRRDRLSRRIVLVTGLIIIVIFLSLRRCASPSGEPVIRLSEPSIDDGSSLKQRLKSESPVIPIEGYLKACSNEADRAERDNFHSRVLLPRVKQQSLPPLPISRFACLAQCASEEPELERSLKYLGGSSTTYTAKSIASLCRLRHIPLLIRIRDGRVQWTKCERGEKLKASHVFFHVIRTLFVLTRLVQVDDVIFAFDNSDYSRPIVDDPHQLNWNYVLPGVVRFVGDASHPSLLWPTPPFIRMTGYCAFDDNEDDVANPTLDWLSEGGCYRRRAMKEVPWEEKKDIVFWRGSPTGVPIDIDHVQYMPRAMLNRLFASSPGYDVAFLERAIPPYADDRFIQAHLWKPSVHREDFGRFKMIVSLDGHTASWGLIERLGLGSVLLVHESLRGYREHYYDLLQPYKHFIPISFDFSNLEAIRQWVLSSEGNEQAKLIGERAKDLIETRMRPQDMWCYLYRLVATLASKKAFRVDDPLFDVFKWRDIDASSISTYDKQVFAS